VIPLKTVLDVGAPALVFLSLIAVGLDLTPADFRRLREVPGVVVVGVLAPLLLLPALAIALVWWFAPDPFVEAGLLLVAASPIGGISNTYSYLARASTALSVALTGLSCVAAVGAIPVLTQAFAWVLREPIRVDAPLPVLLLQLCLIVALPIGVGMVVRRRRPAWAAARRAWFQRAAFVLLGLLLLSVIAAERERIASVLWQVAWIASTFVILSFAVGWASGSAVRASGSDRFTLAADFATRNIAIATAIAVTMLGRTEFAVFGTVYFLTELPLMLAAVAVWRRWQGSPPASS
jgi:bile acid:Na+ symporter, BASS family